MGLKDGGKPHYFGHRERLRQRFRDAEATDLVSRRTTARHQAAGQGVARPVRHLCRSAKCPRRAAGRGARHWRGRDHRDQTRACGGDAADAWRGAGTSGAVLLGLLPSLDELRDQGAVPYPVLDKRNQIIADEVQQKGTIDHTPVYVREVVKPAGNGDRAGAQSPLRRPYPLPC
jgi:DNA repair protein RadC